MLSYLKANTFIGLKSLKAPILKNRSASLFVIVPSGNTPNGGKVASSSIAFTLSDI